MKPTDRTSFKQFCLRQLGSPAIKINLSEQQIDDCVDQALFLFSQYHMEGSEKTYYKYQVQQTDLDNGYITVPENILGVIRMFPVGNAIGTSSLFNMRYQFIYNDLYSIGDADLVPYYMAMNRIQFLEEWLIGQKPFRFTRYANRIYLDLDKELLSPGQFVLFEACQVVDPEKFSQVWGDKWLQNYATTLMKKLWGHILSVYEVPMPGNMKINGQKVYTDAENEIKKLEEDLYKNYTNPPIMLQQ